MTDNRMREIKIEKVTLNVGCGADKDKLEKAEKLLKMLTNRKSVLTLSKTRSTFGVPKDKPVGIKVTLRGKAAEDMLKLALTGVENRLKPQQFDASGNFSFGIKEYIDMTNVKYNHEVGMMGFELTITLERAGFRVKKRRARTAKVGKSHVITPQETMQWLKDKYGATIVE
jgi:large subunit ribosomal protein L5